MSVRLFVYGTLLRGQPAHHLLAPATFLGAARVGPDLELHDLGPYPALVRGPGEGWVAGELYGVDAGLLTLLDDYEDCPGLYLREEVRVKGGAAAVAYVLPRARLDTPRRIASGDWRLREPI